jgi:hypothetical protein
VAKQTEQGKAFEYACLKALYDDLSNSQQVIVEDSESYRKAMGFYNDLSTDKANKMQQGALAAVKIIKRLEPRLENSDDDSPLILVIQEDSKGIAGDVRDVVCVRRQNSWEIGLSCKHNHDAVKHSRLSETIDFGEKWFGKASSDKYFDDIEPIFRRLKSCQGASMKWSDVDNKSATVYAPLLSAFITELKQLDLLHPGEVPAQLVRYLLGRNDFYKVMTNEKSKITTIQAYNLNGTLNKPSKSVKPTQRVPKMALPTVFHDISFKDNSNNTIGVTCDGGWVFSFRIHNASTMVEPSLKFDVKHIGKPTS